MQVTMVATGREEECGISTYTSSLETALDVETDRVSVKLRSLDILHYTKKAIEAGLTNADVIHIQHEYGIYGPKSIASWPFLFLIWILSTVRGIPVVVTMHTTWNTDTMDPPLYRMKRLYVNLNNKLIAMVADHIIFLSDNAQEKFEEDIDQGSLTVLPHGVQTDTREIDDAKSVFGYDGPDFVVIEPGYVRPQKGYETFLEIAERLPELEFLIAGGPQDQSHRDYAQEIREQSPANVQITGVLDEEDFHAAFNAADLVLLPYESVTQSGILNWCIAYELPVIASNKEYFRNLSDRCDGIRSYTSTEQAVELVQELAENREQQSEMEQGMANYKKQNSIEQIAEKHLTIYRGTIRS